MKKVILFCLITLACSVALAQYNDSGIFESITYLIEKEPHPKHGDTEWSGEIAMAIENAAQKYDLDPYLLTAMAEIESDFAPDTLKLKKLGPAGEKGLLQCGKDCARKCPHFMDTIGGQALCGARWLRMAWDTCEGKGGRNTDEFAALAYYASGEYCNPPKGHDSIWKANKRIRLKERLKNRFGGE